MPQDRPRRPRARRRDSLRLYAITGILGIAIGLTIVYLSYTANGGLPLARTYRVWVQLPNAQRLQRGSDVRIGGIRVGQVQSVAASTGPHGTDHPFARLQLSLSPSVGHLPVDSHVEEQPASVLGASYLQLTLGTSRRTLAPQKTLALSQASPTVQLTDLLDIFNRSTGRSIQSSLDEASGAFAGRGGDFNSAIASFNGLLPSLQDVSQTLAAPSTGLAGFIVGLDSFSTALAPVSSTLGSLLGNAATTFAAFRGDRGALGNGLGQLPATEQVATTALTKLDPALTGVAQLAHELVPGARLVRTAVPQLTRALADGTASLTQIKPLTTELQATLRALGTLSRDPSTAGLFKVLGQGTTATVSALDALLPAQVQCNVIALWGRNVALSAQQGTGEFPFVPLGVVGTGADNEYAQHATPSSNLHTDYLPHENDQECESGNEPYSSSSQDLSNPPGNQPNTTQMTSAPAGATADAQRAGLLSDLRTGRAPLHRGNTR